MELLKQYITEILLLLLLTITFLQSSIDKMVDWKGNLTWLRGHFSKTFLRSGVPMALFTILLLEFVAGIASLLGVGELLLYGTRYFGLLGATLSCLAFLMLLFGQRIAKDYDGARTIVIYFVPAIFAVFLLAN